MSRISLLDGLRLLAEPAGTALSGLLYRHAGYYAVFTVSGGFALAGVLYVVLVLPESRPAGKVGPGWNGPGRVVAVVCRARSGYRRSMILLSLATLVLHNLQDKSSLYLYCRRKFQWTEAEFTLYSTVDSVHSFTRALVVTPALSKLLHVHEPMIGALGAGSWVCYFAVTALATRGWMMYLATGLSSIGAVYTVG